MLLKTEQVLKTKGQSARSLSDASTTWGIALTSYGSILMKRNFDFEGSKLQHRRREEGLNYKWDKGLQEVKTKDKYFLDTDRWVVIGDHLKPTRKIQTTRKLA